MEYTILEHPYILLLYVISVGLCLWNNRAEKSGLLTILAAVFASAGMVAAFFAGASLQELLISVLVLVLFNTQHSGKDDPDEL